MPGGYLRNFCEKTQMCKFHQVGACSKGRKCVFAHSPDELRAPPDLSRTKLCPTLIAMGACNSSTCRFAHNKEQLRRINPQSHANRKPSKKAPVQFKAGQPDGSPGSDASTSYGGSLAALEVSGLFARSVSCPDEAIGAFTVDPKAQPQKVFQMSQGDATPWPTQPIVAPMMPQWSTPKPWETGTEPLASGSGGAAAVPPRSPSLTSSEGNSPRPTCEDALFDDNPFFSRSVSCPDSTFGSALEAFGKWESQKAQELPQLRVNVKNTFLEVEPMQQPQPEPRRHSVHGHPGEQPRRGNSKESSCADAAEDFFRMEQPRRGASKESCADAAEDFFGTEQPRRGASKESCADAAEDSFRMEQPKPKEEEGVRSPVNYRRRRNSKDEAQRTGGADWASQQPAPPPARAQAAASSTGGLAELAVPRMR